MASLTSITIGASCLGLRISISAWASSPPPFTVLRLLTPLGMTYEAAKKSAEPYDKIVGELPEMRTETVQHCPGGVRQQIQAYVAGE